MASSVGRCYLHRPKSKRKSHTRRRRRTAIHLPGAGQTGVKTAASRVPACNTRLSVSTAYVTQATGLERLTLTSMISIPAALRRHMDRTTGRGRLFSPRCKYSQTLVSNWPCMDPRQPRLDVAMDFVRAKDTQVGMAASPTLRLHQDSRRIDTQFDLGMRRDDLHSGLGFLLFLQPRLRLTMTRIEAAQRQPTGSDGSPRSSLTSSMASSWLICASTAASLSRVRSPHRVFKATQNVQGTHDLHVIHGNHICSVRRRLIFGCYGTCLRSYCAANARTDLSQARSETANSSQPSQAATPRSIRRDANANFQQRPGSIEASTPRARA